MNKLAVFFLLVLVAGGVQAGLLNEVLSSTYDNELKRLQSPDGHSTAILVYKEQHGSEKTLGPIIVYKEPRVEKMLGRLAQLKVIKDGKTIYDSGDEPLNIYQMSPTHALDLMWSPDSTRLAYRHITALRIIGPDGKETKYSIIPENTVISSFKWIDQENLLVVSKKGQYRLNQQGEPYYYQGYIDKAEHIYISRLNLTKGQTARYHQALHNPTFLFHSVDFCPTEISTKSDRVAFSDGVNLCVYDDTVGKVIAQFKIPQKPTTPVFSSDAEQYAPLKKAEMEMAARPDELDGIWWQTNSKLLVGLELLGREEKRAFFTFDIPSQQLIDVTKTLLPLWKDYYRKSHKNVGIDYYGWQDPDWYKLGIE
jgi:hypothetical protein